MVFVLKLLLQINKNRLDISLFSTFCKMNSQIKVLDGGLGSDLFINGGYNKQEINNDPLWLARVTYENPDAIKACHKRFINAGSEVISTGSYQAFVQGYVEYCGLTVDKAKAVIGSSFDIAQTAIDECSPEHDVTIAGSISPYGATLHDMSEYTGSYIAGISKDDLKEFHKTNVRILAEKGVKLFAFETLPALKEAQVLAEILYQYPDCKAWVSFTTQTGTHTSYGDPFGKVFEAFCNNPQILAVGTNCSNPKLTINVLNAAKNKLGNHQSCIVYPDNRLYETEMPDEWPFINDLHEWLATGLVGWVGGCCLTTPNHIKQIKKVVQGVRN